MAAILRGQLHNGIRQRILIRALRTYSIAFRGGQRSGRPGAPRARTSPGPLYLPSSAVRGLQLSRGDGLEDPLLKRQVRNQAL